VAASADPVRTYSTDGAAFVAPEGGGVGPRAFTGTGFELGEGYSIATCSNNNGWRAFGSANLTPPGPRHGFIEGPGVGNNGSDNAGFITHLAAHPDGTRVGCFSPTFMNPLDPIINVDINVDDILGMDYVLNPQSPAQGYTTTRVFLYYTGAVAVIDDLDGPGPGGASIELTTFSYTAGSYFTFQFVFDFAGGSIDYYAGPDKDNLGLIYDGNTWTPATQVDEMVVFGYNFASFGGSASGRPLAGMYFDNLVMKPEPGTLAMLAIGAVVALRRRR
jgi:hypothetical protein